MYRNRMEGDHIEIKEKRGFNDWNISTGKWKLKHTIVHGGELSFSLVIIFHGSEASENNENTLHRPPLWTSLLVSSNKLKRMRRVANCSSFPLYFSSGPRPAAFWASPTPFPCGACSSPEPYPPLWSFRASQKKPGLPGYFLSITKETAGKRAAWKVAKGFPVQRISLGIFCSCDFF